MCLWFVRVKLPPFPSGRDHSVTSVRLKGAFALGGIKMLSILPLVPPSAIWMIGGLLSLCASAHEGTANTINGSSIMRTRIANPPRLANSISQRFHICLIEFGNLASFTDGRSLDYAVLCEAPHPCRQS